MKKRRFYLMLCMTIGILMGCGHEHTWEDATCANPKVCIECGETEGEALEHTLMEATYTQPATCSICGETEGEVLKPVATETEIAELQLKMDKFVEVYNNGNQKAINMLSDYLANDGDRDELIQGLQGELGDWFDFAWSVTAIPMTFYNDMNEGLDMQCTLETYQKTSVDMVNAYLQVAQENPSAMSAWGIMLFATMEYVEEIATGSPRVLDIIQYEEAKAIQGMCIKAQAYGIVDVNGEIYYAYLMGDNKVIDIYPADEEYFSFSDEN